MLPRINVHDNVTDLTFLYSLTTQNSEYCENKTFSLHINKNHPWHIWGCNSFVVEKMLNNFNFCLWNLLEKRISNAFHVKLLYISYFILLHKVLMLGKNLHKKPLEVSYKKVVQIC